MRNYLWFVLALAGAASAVPAADLTVLNDDAHFAEGPIWYHGKLYYVEYDRNSVTTWDGKQNRIFWSKPGCGPSAVIPTASGEFLTTCYDGGTIGHIAADGRICRPTRTTRTAIRSSDRTTSRPTIMAASTSRARELRRVR